MNINAFIPNFIVKCVSEEVYFLTRSHDDVVEFDSISALPLFSLQSNTRSSIMFISRLFRCFGLFVLSLLSVCSFINSFADFVCQNES